ncbi:hypothetical protein [Aquimarina algicola]|uniref:Lipocalin family protein n=1 Tax=Aquimarina algicola TaxID=2589995 RepID=A0A504IZB1_9FLAO|nr:hypothetical protein [Aquimarina algicola]TPN83867.1 hypothetical protein FHK87_18035 [Aquimarina algicola]
MKKIYILFLVSLLSITTYAQESELLGKWQLATIDNVDAEEEYPFPPLLEFLPDNKIIIKFRNPVFWKYKNDTIYIKNKEHEEYRNMMTVLHLHKDTLMVKSYRKEDLVFRRLHKPQKKDLYGIWIVKALEKEGDFDVLFKENGWVHLKSDQKVLLGKQGEEKHFDQSNWRIDLKENVFFFDSDEAIEIIHFSKFYLLLNYKNGSKILLKKK